MRYEIIDSEWHNTIRGSVGIVAIRSFEGKWRAYICPVPGFSQDIDEQVVAAMGTKLSKKLASAYFPGLDIDDCGN